MGQTAFVRIGFVVGLASAAAVAAASAIIAIVLGVPTLPELVWDAAVGVIPGQIFSVLVDTLKYAGKPLFFVGLTVLQLLLGGILGVIYALAVRIDSPLRLVAMRQPWLVGTAWGAVLWAIVFATGSRVFGPYGWTAWAISLASLLAFTVLLAELFTRVALRSPQGEPTEPVDLLRRDLLVRGIIGLIALSFGAFLVRILFANRGGRTGTGPSSPDSATSYITPNAEFYTVSKNFRDPDVDAQSWSLEIKGLVSNNLRFTLEELKSLPSVTRVITLECISNEVGGELMGNAVWRGVPLPDLLAMAGVSSESRDVVLRAADGYSDSIPLEKALSPDTILAYEMNGEPLPSSHGFPVRLLVPGIYGMKNVKWLTSLEPVAQDYKGFWQGEGWSDTAIIRTTSRIDIPKAWKIVGEDVAIAGVAFAGDRGVSRVEVSFDSDSWQPALLGETQSPYTWVLWTLDWHFPTEGQHHIVVRAVDGGRTTQESKEESPFPNGATGYHGVAVTVRKTTA